MADASGVPVMGAPVSFQASPGAQISAVEMPPVGGSLMLAAKACGQERRVRAEALWPLLDRALAA